VNTIDCVRVLASAMLRAVLNALVAAEVRGRLQRRVRQKVEHAIESLPDELRTEWGDKWRAELATVISMPLTAAQYAARLRRTAAQMVGEPALETSDTRGARRARLKAVTAGLLANLVLASFAADGARALSR
jgi:hypothetical protein